MNIQSLRNWIYFQRFQQSQTGLTKEEKDQLALVSQIGAKRISAAEEYAKTAPKLGTVGELDSLLTLINEQKFGVGIYDSVIQSQANKVTAQRKAVETSNIIQSKIEQLRSQVEGPGGRKVIDDLNRQLRSLSGSLAADTQKIIQDDIDNLSGKVEHWSRMSEFDTDMRSPTIDYAEGVPAEDRDFLDDVLQREINVARDTDEYSDVNTLLQRMAPQIRTERRADRITPAMIRTEKKAMDDELAAEDLSKLDRSIAQYKGLADDIRTKLNPYAAGNPYSQQGGMEMHEQETISLVPNVMTHGTSNAAGRISSYDAVGLLSRVDDMLISIFANPAPEFDNQLFVESNPLESNEEKSGRYDVMEKLIAQNVVVDANEKISGYHIKGGVRFSPTKGPVDSRQKAVINMIALREQIIMDMASGIFDPYTDVEGQDPSAKYKSVFSNRKKR